MARSHVFQSRKTPPHFFLSLVKVLLIGPAWDLHVERPPSIWYLTTSRPSAHQCLRPFVLYELPTVSFGDGMTSPSKMGIVPSRRVFTTGRTSTYQFLSCIVREELCVIRQTSNEHLAHTLFFSRSLNRLSLSLVLVSDHNAYAGWWFLHLPSLACVSLPSAMGHPSPAFLIGLWGSSVLPHLSGKIFPGGWPCSRRGSSSPHLFSALLMLRSSSG